ncbi:MAG: hypothetical protein P4M12_08905 [Gammaproteobacteria bacterium]|nr:hypothetical protein [Gammaproteobacteria bacterium]
MFIRPSRQTKNEESTKYFVNGVVCSRDLIYQTILDRRFYDGAVNIQKKYHSKKVEGTFGFMSRDTHSSSTDRNANFNLNTKKFVEKFDPKSEEYKLLIERMLHFVDIFYSACDKYSENSSNLHIATKSCMQFFLESTTNFTAPYNNIMHEYSLEFLVFLFDLTALGISRMSNLDLSSEVKLPSLNIDTSSIKEVWSESLTNTKKSEYLEKYLAVSLKQSGVLYKNLKQNIVFKDLAELESKFDNFKKFIKSMQDKRSALDASLSIRQSFISKFFCCSRPANEIVEQQHEPINQPTAASSLAPRR